MEWNLREKGLDTLHSLRVSIGSIKARKGAGYFF